MRSAKLDRMQRGEYVGQVYSSECCELLDRIDKTGLNANIYQLPLDCRVFHEEEANKHLKMRRRNTITRDRNQANQLQEHLEHQVQA